MISQLAQQFHSLFGQAPTAYTRAPGRIEVVGNHTDYNGGTVFGAAIDRGVTVAIAPRSDGRRRFYSPFAPKVIEVGSGAPTKQEGEASWINYPLGVLAALEAFKLKVPAGFDFFTTSDLPAGAGLSSSAALELSSALAFLQLTGETPDRETVVKIGRHAENHFVGVPCGILDQGVSGFGERGHLVYIDCRGPRFATVPMPDDAHFWIFNTHTKHALVDGLYATRHRECMEAAQSLGVKLLADLTPAQLSPRVTTLPSEVGKRARHVVEEIDRVAQTEAALRKGDIHAVGRLLTASHQSSRTLFENSTPELDTLVELLVAQPGVYGARLTGGGFGGAVMALTNGAFAEGQAAKVAEAYAARHGSKPDVLHCQTGPGAAVL